MAEKKEFYVDKKIGFISSNQVLETPKGRLLYPNLKKPSSMSNKYQFRILFPKDQSVDPDTKKKLKAFIELGKELLKAAGSKAKGHKHPPIKNGDEEDDVRLHGHWYIQAGNVNLPQLVDIRKQHIDAGDLVGGMIVKATVTPSFFSANGAGISYQANALMLVKDDGTRISGAVDGVSAFSDEEDEDGEDEDFDSGLDDLDDDEEEAPKSKAKSKPKAKAKPPVKKKKVEVEEEDEDDLDADLDEDDLDDDLEEDEDDLDEDSEFDDEDEEEEEEEVKPKAKVRGRAKPAPAAKTPVKKKAKKSDAEEMSDIL